MAQRILKVLRHFTQICAYGAGRGSFLGPVRQTVDWTVSEEKEDTVYKYLKSAIWSKQNLFISFVDSLNIIILPIFHLCGDYTCNNLKQKFKHPFETGKMTVYWSE